MCKGTKLYFESILEGEDQRDGSTDPVSFYYLFVVSQYHYGNERTSSSFLESKGEGHCLEVR